MQERNFEYALVAESARYVSYPCLPALSSDLAREFAGDAETIGQGLRAILSMSTWQDSQAILTS